MKRHNKTIKKGMAIATSAMLVMPTSTIGFAQEQSTNSPTSKNIASAQQILENPPSTATPAKDTMNVYTSFTKGNSDNSGNGSINNPYNRFEDAVAKVANGGTIYITGEAFLNDVGNNLPFLIDKNITIKTVDGQNNASLSVRSAGIILGANVKFENISLDFANKHHDSIFANGYTLDLINVTRSSGSRDIDLFAGGLYNLADGTQVHPSGNKGVINVETNGSFKGGDLESDFGNIYAGSMNGVFNGSAEINVSRKDKSKKLVIGAIKSSGALEAATGSMLDTTEPLPPAENPSQFPTNGEVSINLDNYQVSVDGTTGSNSKTSVTTSTEYLNTLELKNVDHLKVESGEIQAVYENTDANTIPNITLGEKAILDLSQAGIIDVENYNGNGTITLGKNGKLNITKSVNGSIKFQTEGGWSTSGKVNEDHVYITTPNKNAVISFTPHNTQTHLELVGRTKGSVVEWVTQEIGKDNTGSDETTDLAEITGFEIENAEQVKPYNELNDTNSMSYATVKFPFKLVTDADLDSAEEDFWLDLNNYEFGISVNGKNAVRHEDEEGFVSYVVDDLGLSMYVNSLSWDGEHELVIEGLDSNPIKVGEYNINVSHAGVELNSKLTVTGGDADKPEDDEELPPIEEVTPDQEGWLKASTIGQVGYLWDYEINEDDVLVLKSFKGVNTKSEDVKVEIPREIEGHKVALANLNTATFKGVTHIQVEDSNKEQVKVLATKLTEGFLKNKKLKYVDLEGLYVGKVEDMTSLFSMCNNLQFIKIKDWVIKHDTSIEAMFYAKKSATNEEKKILVITDNERINSYDFKSSNRLPYTTTFSAEGGNFLGEKDIHNMKVEHFTVETDDLDKLKASPQYDPSQMRKPTREGYEFVQWNTDSEPTNVYEFLDMTYKAEWKAVEKEEEEETPVVQDKIYLSDLGYVKHMSSVGWGSIQTDRSVDGDYISLIVDGERTEFEKGIGAHAPSNVVFDIRDKSNEYTRLKARVGIDASRGENGNGAFMIAYTSQDGITWKEVHRTKVLKGTSESVEMDIDVTGVKLIKLHSNANGGNMTADHVSYGDLKLVKEGYVEEEIETLEGVKTVAEYDAILSANTPEYNMEHNKLTILQRAFVKKVGYKNVSIIANKNEKYKEAINFLMTNETALNYLITGGDVNVEGSYTRSIRYFCDIYSQYGADLQDATDNHFNLRLALSTSLAFANHNLVRFWQDTNKEISAVNRYKIYQDLVESGQMDKGGNTEDYGKWSTEQFKKLPIPLMRWTVDNRINDDEIFWLTDLALSKKASTNKDYLSAYTYINYTDGYNYNRETLYDMSKKDEYSKKYGNFTDYFDDYGTKGLHRLWMIFEEGSVCGGLAKTYSNIADAFGRPSSVMGQPGHAATMTWGWHKENKRYEWMLQNDIYGWAKSGNEYNDRMLNWGNKPWTIWHNASYNVLATDAVLDNENFMKATTLNFLAESYTESADKKAIYLEALKSQSINLDSMEGLINSYKANESTTSAEYLELAKLIIKTYTYYPQVMMELLALIEGEITNDGDAVQLDILKSGALLSASNATPEKSTNVTMSKQLASKYLDGEEAIGEVATFSFDGENAGKIVLNSKYEDSQIMLEYSLDGGTTWKQTDEKVIALSKDELASITAENDIKISLVGVDTVHTIDILEGETITTSKVFANDFENLLLGSVANLEFSLDGGNEWCDYVTGQEATINPNGITGIRFKGDQTVKVRYKANGTRLQSAEVEYKFTENTYTDSKKYVQLRNVKVTSASAHQSGQPAEKIIDGNLTNGYHTNYTAVIPDKHIIFEFDQPRYISSMEYVFIGGNNGRLKSGEIQASLDGQTWTTVKTFVNMDNRGLEVQEFVMDEVIEAKYIKIVATETHGNGGGEADKYLAGKEIRFYEDITKLDKEETETNPPADEEGKDEENKDENQQQPPVGDEGEGEDKEENDNTGNETPSPNPPVGDEEEEDKEDGEDKEEEEEDKEDTQPNPPVGGGGDSLPPENNNPEQGEDKEEEEEIVPPAEDEEPANGIENLKDYDKELQEKVDSLIAESTVDKQQELVLSIVGDDSDLDNVSHVEVTKDGIYAVVDGEKLKFEVELDGLNLDLTKSRAIRVNASRNSIVKYSAVAHKNIEDGLKITSNNLENILITSKVSEPFTDVNDKDWFKADVEEAYNYGFTQGTTATTYSPNKTVTRAQFAVMIARALELSEHETELSITLSDLKGKWYAQQVQQLIEAEIITGYKDQSFKGGNELTRQQAAVMLTRLLNYLGVDTTVKGDVQLKDLSSVSSYAQQSVLYLAEKRIIVSGENVAFNPQGKLTRAQMAKMIVQVLKLTSKY